MSKKVKALRIISQNEKTKNFELDEAALASVLLRDDVKDKPVCVVAVAGAFRKGKSFLLNYFLRYCASQSKENWVGSPSDPLEGFSWVKSSQRETTGILVWSEPFIVKLRSGEEVAILLMDTQGTFDTKSSSKDSTVVFALTLLVSSVVVYNLMDNIQEDDLMHLDAFIQYGLLAQKGKDMATAFQKILFLVRDWIHSDESAYGVQGGQQFLDDILEVKNDQKPAHQDLRRNLRKCFSDIGCYLMPEPGKVATKSKNFDGRHSELDEEFVKYLKELVPLLLAPENIEKKTLAGQTINAADLFKNFQIYMEAFNSEDLPEPVSVADGIAKARCAMVVKMAMELYDNGMKEVVEKDNVLSEEDLDDLHSSLLQSALELYEERSSGIAERISSSYKRDLEEGIAKPRCAMVVKKAMELYDNGMKEVVKKDNVLSEGDLDDLHSSLLQSALELFEKRSSGIAERISSSYKRDLEEDLTSLKAQFAKDNTNNATFVKQQKEIERTKADLTKSMKENERTKADLTKSKKENERTKEDLTNLKKDKTRYRRLIIGVTGATAAALGAAGAFIALPTAAAAGVAAGVGGVTVGLQSLMDHVASRKSLDVLEARRERN